MGILVDLSGKKFGAWLVLSKGRRDKNNQTTWLCRCDCGTEKEVVSASLRYGATKSCGCRRGEFISSRKLIHGHAVEKTKTYRIWAGMIKRCSFTNNSEVQQQQYSRRGITVCDRWKHFINFLADMGECPPRRSLDRIDNDKGYYKENCRWATTSQQHANRRRQVSPGKFEVRCPHCTKILQLKAVMF